LNFNTCPLAGAVLATVFPCSLPTTVALCVPVTSPESDPLKFVAVVAVVADVALVAVVALPLRLPVIVPAAKFPDASRFTIMLAVFVEVALLAACVPVATFVDVWPPTDETTVEL
jgi:hypothetical protein